MPTVSQYRSDLNGLVRLAQVDLQVLWRQASDGVVSRAQLTRVLEELSAAYGSAAGTVAADWYDDLRAEQQIRGRFTARAAAAADAGQIEALAGWSLADDTAVGSLTRAAGGLQRLIADVGRSTVIGSSLDDPRAQGWQRVADGGCGFCILLASRGAVYSEASVDFGAHDHCRCSAAPAFEGRERPVSAYTPSVRDVTDADRARTRQWMAEHGY